MLKSGEWFQIEKPDFSNSADSIRFQMELLIRGIHIIEVTDLMFTLVVGMLFAPKVEVYRRV